MGQEPAESSRVRFSGQTNMGAVVVSVCCSSPDEVDEACFEQQ